MKKIGIIILQFLILMNVNIKNANAIIKITPNEIFLGINDNTNLKISNTTSNNVSWQSSNPNIVSVDNNGKITGVNIGEAYVKVSDGNSMALCRVKIIDNYVPVKSINLNKTEENMLLTDVIKITANILPANSSNKILTYTSSAPDIVSVTESGYITAKKVGTANISISIEGKSTILKVNVIDKISLKDIKIDPTVQIKKGETTKLTVTYNPANATNKEVTWQSSDETIVSVDTNGNIKGISKGEATITVKSKDGNYIATSKVTVNSPEQITNNANNIKLKGIRLNKKKISLKKGETIKLDITYTPSDATNKEIIWSSSDENIVSITDGTILAVSPGTAEIKITSIDGNFKDKCNITVYSNLPIESIKFENVNQDIYVGHTLTLNTISTPENTMIDNPIWSSSDENIATVENGVVTGLNIGTATITISDNNNKVFASTIVNVIKKPIANKLSVSITGYNFQFNPDIKKYTLKIKNESSLNIETNYDYPDVIIGGNRDLKNGSIITIVSNENTNDKKTYIIKIKKQETNITWFIVTVILLLTLNVVRLLKNNKNPNNMA